MKFHRPSLLHYLRELLPERLFTIYAHRWALYIIPPNTYFTWPLMREYFVKAVVQSCGAPLGAPDGPQQRSLFAAPPAAHLDALTVALSERSDYAQIHHISTEVGERLEYRIDLRAVRDIIIATRRKQDVVIAAKLLQDEMFMSYRLLNKKMRRQFGREFSDRRVHVIMTDLVKVGLCKSNGNLRTAGLDVLKPAGSDADLASALQKRIDKERGR